MTAQQKYALFKELYAKHLACFHAGDISGYFTTQKQIVGFDWGVE